MGGFGSTRWTDHAKHQTADDSFRISVLKISDELRQRTRKTIRYGWKSEGQPPQSIQLTLDSRVDREPAVQLDYWLRGAPKRQRVNLMLNTNRNPVNGHWRFRCPACGRKCGCLYFPQSNGTEFRCRTCWELTYRSAQVHDKRLADVLRGMALSNRLTLDAGKNQRRSQTSIEDFRNSLVQATALTDEEFEQFKALLGKCGAGTL